MNWEEPVGTSDFKSVADGSYSARCIRIVDLGTQRDEYQGEVTHKRKVIFTWELPTEKMEDGQPMIATKFYRQSLHEKSNLRRDLEGWLQEKYDAFVAKNDPSLLLGLAALVSVNAGKVTAVIKPPKGMTIPKAVNPLVYFDLDHFDRAVYEGLSDGLKAMIAKSPEWEALQGYQSTPEPAPEPESEADGLPF